MAFTHVQGKAGTTATATLSIVLSAAPTTGNMVCVGLCSDKTGTTITSVKDSNNNVYTKSTNSPSTFESGAGLAWGYYLLSAPSNASATITAIYSQSPTGSNVGFADEFSISGGTTAFDKDAVAGTTTASTTISTPSITPAGSGELLYAVAAAGGTIASAGTPWTGTAGVVESGDWAEYDLSASAATAVKFTQSSGGWSAVAMAFSFTASGGTSTKRLTLLGVG